jgi:hypothetical protein
MRIKASIFAVIISFLWISLQSPGPNHSDNNETRFSAHIVDTSFDRDEGFIWKKSSSPDWLVQDNSATREVRIYCETLMNLASFKPIPVKFYLRFRVFRN